MDATTQNFKGRLNYVINFCRLYNAFTNIVTGPRYSRQVESVLALLNKRKIGAKAMLMPSALTTPFETIPIIAL
jgi:hypothetical protein